jgi:hypothetical protein
MESSKTLERLIFGLFIYGILLGNCAFSQAPEVSSSKLPVAPATATDLGVSFVKDSTSQIVVERDGKKYVVDLASHEIREAAAEPANVAAANSASSDSGQPASPVANANIYRPSTRSSRVVPQFHSSLSLPGCLHRSRRRRHADRFG